MRAFHPRRVELRPGRPLLPATARPWVLLIAACCSVITVVIGVIVAHQHAPAGVDHAIGAPVYGALGAHKHALLLVVALGSPVPVLVLTAVIVAGCLLAGRLNGAILGILAPPLAIGLDEVVLKPLFHRADLGFLSYPSGHTTAVVTLGSTVTLLLAFPAANSARMMMRRVLTPALAGLIACLVAIALIGLRWHYFSDTVGGAAVAIGMVCALALLLDLTATRRLLGKVTPDRSAAEAGHAGPAAGAADERLADPRAT